MKKHCVLSLDIGTSSVRAILFDSHGSVLTDGKKAPIEAQSRYDQTTTADGGVETDADQLLERTITCVAQTVRRAARAGLTIDAVGISCFWHSLVGVGGDNRAVTPVYSWADTRSGRFVPQLRSLLASDSYHSVTGAELHPCFWPAKLLWLRETQPRLFTDKTRWLGFADYMMLRLFGDGGPSISMASGTGLFNQQAAAWDTATLACLHIDESSLLPPTDQPLTGVRPEYRSRLGAVGDIPWFRAVGDGACSNIGSGGADDGRIVLNIGTSAAMRVVISSAAGDPISIRKGLFSYRVDAAHVIQGGAFANGGNVFAWLKSTLMWNDDDAFLKSVAKIKPDGHGLTVLPFWAGERSPGWRSNAHATIAGMNLHTSRADIVRASLEACAYSFESTRRTLVDQFPQARQLVVTGGAVANSRLLPQIICDVFGAPLVTGKVAEASSRGAALIALNGIGAIKSWSSAPFERDSTFRPNSDRHKIYADAIKRYDLHYRKDAAE